MDLKEASQFSAGEELEHWWIKTRFLHLEAALQGYVPTHGVRADILEIGCGTGVNLQYLRARSPSRSRVGKLTGVDVALPDGFTTRWATPSDRFENSLARVEAESADVLLAMDVIEHVDDDTELLKNSLEKIRPGGLVFVTVPAFQLLWSGQDVFLEHRRRYTKRTLGRAGEAAGLETLRLSYVFGHLFVPALVIRRLAGRGHRIGSDLVPTGKALNGLLFAAGKIEAAFRGNPLCGTSVVGAFRKPTP